MNNDYKNEISPTYTQKDRYQTNLNYEKSIAENALPFEYVPPVDGYNKIDLDIMRKENYLNINNIIELYFEFKNTNTNTNTNYLFDILNNYLKMCIIFTIYCKKHNITEYKVNNFNNEEFMNHIKTYINYNDIKDIYEKAFYLFIGNDGVNTTNFNESMYELIINYMFYNFIKVCKSSNFYHTLIDNIYDNLMSTKDINAIINMFNNSTLDIKDSLTDYLLYMSHVSFMTYKYYQQSCVQCRNLGILKHDTPIDVINYFYFFNINSYINPYLIYEYANIPINEVNSLYNTHYSLNKSKKIYWPVPDRFYEEIKQFINNPIMIVNCIKSMFNVSSPGNILSLINEASKFNSAGIVEYIKNNVQEKKIKKYINTVIENVNSYNINKYYNYFLNCIYTIFVDNYIKVHTGADLCIKIAIDNEIIINTTQIIINYIINNNLLDEFVLNIRADVQTDAENYTSSAAIYNDIKKAIYDSVFDSVLFDLGEYLNQINQIINQINQMNVNKNQMNVNENQMNENQMNVNENQMNENQINQIINQMNQMNVNENQMNVNENQMNVNENQMNVNENQMNVNENQMNLNENQMNVNENQMNVNENQMNVNENQMSGDEIANKLKQLLFKECIEIDENYIANSQTYKDIHNAIYNKVINIISTSIFEYIYQYASDETIFLDLNEIINQYSEYYDNHLVIMIVSQIAIDYEACYLKNSIGQYINNRDRITTDNMNISIKDYITNDNITKDIYFIKYHMLFAGEEYFTFKQYFFENIKDINVFYKLCNLHKSMLYNFNNYTNEDKKYLKYNYGYYTIGLLDGYYNMSCYKLNHINNFNISPYALKFYDIGFDTGCCYKNNNIFTLLNKFIYKFMYNVTDKMINKCFEKYDISIISSIIGNNNIPLIFNITDVIDISNEDIIDDDEDIIDNNTGDIRNNISSLACGIIAYYKYPVFTDDYLKKTNNINTNINTNININMVNDEVSEHINNNINSRKPPSVSVGRNMYIKGGGDPIDYNRNDIKNEKIEKLGLFIQTHEDIGDTEFISYINKNAKTILNIYKLLFNNNIDDNAKIAINKFCINLMNHFANTQSSRFTGLLIGILLRSLNFICPIYAFTPIDPNKAKTKKKKKKNDDEDADDDDDEDADDDEEASSKAKTQYYYINKGSDSDRMTAKLDVPDKQKLPIPTLSPDGSKVNDLINIDYSSTKLAQGPLSMFSTVLICIDKNIKVENIKNKRVSDYIEYIIQIIYTFCKLNVNICPDLIILSPTEHVMATVGRNISFNYIRHNENKYKNYVWMGSDSDDIINIRELNNENVCNRIFAENIQSIIRTKPNNQNIFSINNDTSSDTNTTTNTNTRKKNIYKQTQIIPTPQKNTYEQTQIIPTPQKNTYDQKKNLGITKYAAWSYFFSPIYYNNISYRCCPMNKEDLDFFNRLCYKNYENIKFKGDNKTLKNFYLYIPPDKNEVKKPAPKKNGKTNGTQAAENKETYEKYSLFSDKSIIEYMNKHNIREFENEDAENKVASASAAGPSSMKYYLQSASAYEVCPTTDYIKQHFSKKNAKYYYDLYAKATNPDEKAHYIYKYISAAAARLLSSFLCKLFKYKKKKYIICKIDNFRHIFTDEFTVNTLNGKSFYDFIINKFIVDKSITPAQKEKISKKAFEQIDIDLATAKSKYNRNKPFSDVDKNKAFDAALKEININVNTIKDKMNPSYGLKKSHNKVVDEYDEFWYLPVTHATDKYENFNGDLYIINYKIYELTNTNDLISYDLYMFQNGKICKIDTVNLTTLYKRIDADLKSINGYNKKYDFAANIDIVTFLCTLLLGVNDITQDISKNIQEWNDRLRYIAHSTDKTVPLQTFGGKNSLLPQNKTKMIIIIFFSIFLLIIVIIVIVVCCVKFVKNRKHDSSTIHYSALPIHQTQQ